MNVGSLFSGIGGIELGFEREGFTTKWFVEWDEYCQAVLKKNFPNTPIYGDITKIDFRELEPVDILTGGFPCQDISIAGKGKGIIEGERSSLWKEFARAIGEVQPKYAVIENVSAITFRGLCNVLSDLAEKGYDAEWFDLRASDVGAPHRRERIFIIAYRNGNGCRHSSKRCEKRGLQSAQSESRKCITLPKCVPSDIDKLNGRCLQSDDNEPRYAGKIKKSIFSNSDSQRLEEKGAEQQTTRFSGQIPLFITDDWGERIQRFKQESFQGVEGFSRFQNVRRVEELQGRPDIPEPLIRRSSNGVSNRVDRTRALGNAVVPQVAQFVARQIKEVEQK